jgi:hypothetical protein
MTSLRQALVHEQISGPVQLQSARAIFRLEEGMKIKVSQPIMIITVLFLFSTALAQSPRVVRWEKGSPNSEQFKRKDAVVKQVKVDGVFVEAYIRDTGFGFRVDLNVSNASRSPLDIRPESITVALTSPRAKSLASIPAKNLQNMILSSAQSRAMSKELSGSMATKTVVETTSKYVDVTTYTADGPKTEPRFVTETKVKTVPDDHARWQAEHEASNIRHGAYGEARFVLREVLKPATLQHAASTSGALYFSRDSDVQEVLLSVPLGDLTVEIPFKAVKKKAFLWVKVFQFE